MEEKIIINRLDAEEFLDLLMETAMVVDNPNQYYTTTQIIENIANEFRNLCKL